MTRCYGSKSNFGASESIKHEKITFNFIHNNTNGTLISPTFRHANIFARVMLFTYFWGQFSQAKIKIVNEPCNGTSHPFHRIKCAKYFSQISSFDISICVSQKNTHSHIYTHIHTKYGQIEYTNVRPLNAELFSECWCQMEKVLNVSPCMCLCVWFVKQKNDSFPLVKRKMHVMVFNPWENERKWSHIYFWCAIGPPPAAKSPSIH